MILKGLDVIPPTTDGQCVFILVMSRSELQFFVLNWMVAMPTHLIGGSPTADSEMRVPIKGFL